MAAAAEYDLQTQSKIPAALAALHNFIRTWDSENMAYDEDEDNDLNMDVHEDGDRMPISPKNLGSNTSPVERLHAGAKRDEIAQAMWEVYQEELHIRGEI